MAQSSIAQKLKALPRARHGAAITEDMSPKQLKVFREWMAEFNKTPRHERPTRDVLAAAVSKDIGMKISKHTLARYINVEQNGS
jgi:hypothetical protein